MIDAFLRIAVKCLLWPRYRIRVLGRKAVADRGVEKVLLLPNHPALIDPIILMAHLHKPFRPRALAVAHQVDRFCIRRLARRMGVRTLPDLRIHGPSAAGEVERAVADVTESLRRGRCLLLYPSGHLYRGRYEDLRGNTAVETILRQVPDARVVAVRTKGLWGSGFSWASGRPPEVAPTLRRGLLGLLASGLLFAPRRRVTIELREITLDADGDRTDLNAALERWYNEEAPPNTYVPYSIWERGGRRTVPEPVLPEVRGDSRGASPATRKAVLEYLEEHTGRGGLDDADDLAVDLGMDSLARAGALTWLDEQFGATPANVDEVRTVGDLLLAAEGQLIESEPRALPPAPRRWREAPGRIERLGPPRGGPIPEAFLARARAAPGRMVLADATSGAKSYRDIVLAVMALRPTFRSLPGERLGIMLPASVGASVSCLAALFSGRTPVLLNWTVGPRHLTHCADLVGVERVVTSRRLVERLTAQGVDLGAVRERLVCLEDIAASLTRRRKLSAWIGSRVNWSSLAGVSVPDVAAILFTSGSESLPKAVPLTHENILTNVRDLTSAIELRSDDTLMSILPPFHAFGLTVNVFTPLCAGLRSAYCPDPNDAVMIARGIETYRATLLVGTPTFLGRICRAAAPRELATLRLAVTGAERCPRRVYDALRRLCPRAVILEGYGITECSPVVSVNDERSPKPMTIGRPLPSFEHAVVRLDRSGRAASGERGLLLLRGPCVFGGYLGPEAPDPFETFEGRRWYVTGDLVSKDADGVLTFRGRLKRFAKVGGEMISLPAIEAALEPHFVREDDDEPVLAVVATGGEDRPELVLFITRPADRATVNGLIREAGLSGLHSIRRVETVRCLPLLGTGKVDYRALEAGRRAPA